MPIRHPDQVPKQGPQIRTPRKTKFGSQSGTSIGDPNEEPKPWTAMRDPGTPTSPGKQNPLRTPKCPKLGVGYLKRRFQQAHVDAPTGDLKGEPQLEPQFSHPKAEESQLDR